ncbi:MAG: PQQ-binding-like beta-propeller repeat protein, partial [Deltaproteobacteria bacterium]|nr:PQQ-binding-like beta-propeller repeat protein [Deltaproteobacteria bacterium]
MKKIIISLLALTFVSCAHGPIKKIQEQRYTGKWKRNFSSKNIGLSQMTAHGDSVYWGTELGEIFRIATPNMKKIWRVEVGDAITTPVFVHGEYVYVGTQKGDIVCLDMAKGKKRWSKNYNTSIRGPFTLFQDHLFFLGLDGQVFGIDFVTGKIGFSQRFFVNDSFTLAYELLTAVSDD